MRIGFCTGFSREEVEWAAITGFDTLEVWALPDGRREWKQARDVFDKAGLAPMSVFHMADYGSADKQVAREAIRGAFAVMEQCVVLGAPVFSCNGFAGHSGGEADKIKRFGVAFRKLAKKARDLGLKIAIENCPHGQHNIMYSPATWERCFNEVDDEVVGLEFDPSHLVWMGIDYLVALKKFASRTYAFHAKDTEVMEDILQEVGIQGSGWWRYRMPGWGEVDWRAIMTILWESGYDGDISIEHEDPVLDGPRRREGLIRGLEFLGDLIYRERDLHDLDLLLAEDADL